MGITMTTITNAFHEEQVEYKGYTIAIEVGPDSDDRVVAQSKVYANSVSIGLDMKTFSAQTSGTVEEQTQDVLERAMHYIDSWILKSDDIKDSMQVAISGVMTEPAITEVDGDNE